MTFISINIQIIPHSEQRYETYGDFWIDETGGLQIRVSEFADPDIAFRIAMHELAEAWRCAKRGLDFAEVDKFDLEHLDHDDPGLLKCAPYHQEHVQSMNIERLLCHQDGVNFDDHYNAVPTHHREDNNMMRIPKGTPKPTMPKMGKVTTAKGPKMPMPKKPKK